MPKGHDMTKLDILRASEPWQWPEDAAATLLDVLRDREGSDDSLFLAAELAGDLPDLGEGVALALLGIAGDARCSERSRCAATASLGPLLDNAEMEGFEDDLSGPAVSQTTFREICDGLESLYRDAAASKTLRRRALEASCMASRDWHPAAVRAAYASGDAEWRLTAVFSMRFINGFLKEILTALSDEDEYIRREALLAAGNWEIEEAWPQVAELLSAGDTARPLLLAAIEAAPTIAPAAELVLLSDLADDRDDEIADAAAEAMMLAEQLRGFEESFDDDD